jgi:hypothetical protein
MSDILSVFLSRVCSLWSLCTQNSLKIYVRFWGAQRYILWTLLSFGIWCLVQYFGICLTTFQSHVSLQSWAWNIEIEGWGRSFLRNVGNHLSGYTVSRPRRLIFIYNWLECVRYSDCIRAGLQRDRSSSPGRVKNFRALFPGVKRPGRIADRSPSASAEVKKTWVCTSTPTYAFMIVLN